MNGVDYAKNLRRERDYFKEIVKKNNESTERRVSENDEITKKTLEKQKDKFVEDKADIESTFQKNTGKIKEKTKNDFDFQSKKFNEQLVKEKVEFNKDSVNKSKDFDQRLNEIQSSYKRAGESEKELHTNLTKAQKNRYDNNVKNIILNTDDKLKDYQSRSSSAIGENKDDYIREKLAAKRSQEYEIKTLQDLDFKKRADLKQQMNHHLDTTKRSTDLALEHQKVNASDTLQNVNHQNKNQNDILTRDFSGKMDSAAQKQKNENVKINRETQKLVSNLNQDFNKQMRLKDRVIKNDGSGTLNEVLEKQEVLNAESMKNNRVRHLQNELVQNQRLSGIKTEKDQENFNETFKNERLDASTRMEQKINDERGAKVMALAKEKVKSEQQINNRDYQNRLDRENFEREVAFEKNTANTRLKEVKENFNKTMTTLEEKNALAITDVSKIAKQDKDLFTKKLNETRNQEVYEMKREFARFMDMTVETYEKRLGLYQRENEYLKLTMDKKIESLTDESAKKLENQKLQFDEMKSADTQSQQILNDQRSHDHKSQLNRLNVSFQKKIDKLQVENDSKLKLLTSDYENKLKEVNASKNREVGQKEMQQMQDVARIKTTFEAEKIQLIGQYENQIAELKKGHENQMRELQNFKQIS